MMSLLGLTFHWGVIIWLTGLWVTIFTFLAIIPVAFVRAWYEVYILEK